MEKSIDLSACFFLRGLFASFFSFNFLPLPSRSNRYTHTLYRTFPEGEEARGQVALVNIEVRSILAMVFVLEMWVSLGSRKPRDEAIRKARPKPQFLRNLKNTGSKEHTQGHNDKAGGLYGPWPVTCLLLRPTAAAAQLPSLLTFVFTYTPEPPRLPQPCPSQLRMKVSS